MARRQIELDKTLLDLVRKQKIEDQSELQSALANKGMHVSQPTLSRHLMRLRIAKRNGRYAPPNLVVLRTHPGYANALAAVLDVRPLDGQAGTIAGDDTVFVALLENHTLEELLNSARERLVLEVRAR
jgi:transcriptional regulator of arginine metabolism